MDGRKKLTAAEVHQDLYLGQVAPPARTLLAHRQERPQEEHDEKCIVLHLSEGGGGRDGGMSPQICNRKICHQKYAMLRNVTKGGGDTFEVFFCSAFPFKIANIPNHCCD